MGPAAYPRALARGGAALAAVGSGGILVSLAFVNDPESSIRTGSALLVLLIALAASALLWFFGPGWSAATLTIGAAGFIVVMTLGVGSGGADHQEAAACIAGASGPMFFFLRRRAATVVVGISLVVYASFLGLDDGYADPVTRWMMVASVTAASALVMTWISDRLRILAIAERDAALEVTRLNEILSERVDDLGRFLPSHVAAAVRDARDRSILEPHRQQVAVLFVDLRGFTGFTAGAEPEEVVDVLRQYYGTVGDLAQQFEASIGSFTGDGVMAYFGDPVPLDDPAGHALDMAIRLRTDLEGLRSLWQASGYRLGYGIGIAFGYATLGVVGYEGRRDYAALGSVVNLASRLCGEAADGEIVLDPRANVAVHGRIATLPRTISAKGFVDPIAAHVVPSGMVG